MQLLVYEALGVTPPQFAHVPVVNAPKSKEKLSKRKMQQVMNPEVIALLRPGDAVPATFLPSIGTLGPYLQPTVGRLILPNAPT